MAENYSEQIDINFHTQNKPKWTPRHFAVNLKIPKRKQRKRERKKLHLNNKKKIIINDSKFLNSKGSTDHRIIYSQCWGGKNINLEFYMQSSFIHEQWWNNGNFRQIRGFLPLLDSHGKNTQ